MSKQKNVRDLSYRGNAFTQVTYFLASEKVLKGYTLILIEYTIITKVMC